MLLAGELRGRIRSIRDLREKGQDYKGSKKKVAEERAGHTEPKMRYSASTSCSVG